MYHVMALVAQQSDADKWLDKNPVVLGLIFLVIGGLLLFFGIMGLKSGQSKDKYGNTVTGGMNSVSSLFRVIGGAGACIFALYKIFAGLMG